jgi:membrane-associated phospholipid phosphatase
MMDHWLRCPQSQSTLCDLRAWRRLHADRDLADLCHLGMVRIWKVLRYILASLVLWGSAAVPARAESTLVQVGNVLQVLLPVGAGAISLYRDDTEGLWQLTKSELLTAGVTYGLKYSINSTGPNGESHSFPSGHASITFSAAQFLQIRYGWEYGVPAYLLAGLTGYSRVSGDYHDWGDVIGGAAIGMVASYWFTTPFLGGQAQLMTLPKGAGLAWRTSF